MIFEYLNESVITGMKKEITVPNIGDRSFWDGLSEEIKRVLISEGEKNRETPWSTLLMSDYKKCLETGDRTSFDEKFLSRKIKLASFVFAECAQNKGEFLPDILDGVYLLLEESSWCHPLFDYHEGEKPSGIPDTSKPVIDLFAAETAAVLGTMEYLLRPVLNDIDPVISEYINSRIRERVVVPLLSEDFPWMYKPENKADIRAAEILQDVLVAVFTGENRLKTVDETEVIVKIALKCLDAYLDNYSEDGYCHDGVPGYTRGALCMYGILSILDDVSEGAFDDVFAQNKIRNIAAYIRRIYVDDGYYINFADCPAKADSRTAREYAFGKACKDAELCCLAADDYRVGEWNQKLLTKDSNLYYRLLQIVNHEEMMHYRPFDLPEHEDAYYEDAGLMITRNDKFVLAVKAGNNADIHNHNDVGSVTLYKFGKPMLIDLGQGAQSDKRQDMWTVKSVYHNLPTFYDGHETITELSGEKYAAKDVVYDAEKHKMSFDIAPAFGNKNILTYKRSISLRGEKVFLDDDYDGMLDGVIGFMTYEEPKVKGKEDGNITISVGALGTIKLIGYEKDMSAITIEKCDITDEKLQEIWKHACYRIRIPLKKGLTKIEIS